MNFAQYFIMTLLIFALVGAVSVFRFVCANIVTGQRLSEWIERKIDQTIS